MKKGFTLVELLTVIVVLGIIAVIAVPKIVDTIESSRFKSCKEQVRTIESAAKRWGTENTFDLTIDKTNPNSSMIIKVSDLQDKGYLSKDEIINPVTKANMNEVQVTITYNSDYNQYSYKIIEDVCQK